MRSFPQDLGVGAPDRVDRVTGHADRHRADLTGQPLTVMDRERRSGVPVGFDAGLLHACGLRVPEVEACVRAEFTDIADALMDRAQTSPDDRPRSTTVLTGAREAPVPLYGWGRSPARRVNWRPYPQEGGMESAGSRRTSRGRSQPRCAAGCGQVRQPRQTSPGTAPASSLQPASEAGLRDAPAP